jgi:hypothetical protein
MKEIDFAKKFFENTVQTLMILKKMLIYHFVMAIHTKAFKTLGISLTVLIWLTRCFNFVTKIE